MHVSIAPLKEHIGFGLPQEDFCDLVDVAVCRQAEAGGQGLLVAADLKHLAHQLLSAVQMHSAENVVSLQRLQQ